VLRRHGGIVKDDGKDAIRIARSEYVRHWADELGSLLSEYKRSQDTDGLISGIRRMSDWIGIREKPSPSWLQRSRGPIRD